MTFRASHLRTFATILASAWVCRANDPSGESKTPTASETRESPEAEGRRQASAGNEKTKSSLEKNSRGPVIDGEHFSIRQILDKAQGGIPVCVFLAPEKWHDESHVVWNYGNSSSPVKISANVQNPSNEEAFFAFPLAEYFCLRPDGGFYRPGQNLGGLTYTYEPMPPIQALLALIHQVRAGAPEFKIIGSRDLPDLSKALNLPKVEKQHGIAIKVGYKWKGKSVEEEFYGVSYSVQIPYDGPQGRTWQINWGLNALHSFRAPEGTLEKRRAVFATIARSFRPNPAWQQRLGAINGYLQQEFNRQLQAGYNQIAAAAQLSRQISANNDAMLASIDSRLQATRAEHKPSTERSPNDKFSDYIRGVETVDDPYYGTSQHSYTESYHWTDGYGTYRNSNDPTYNPNQNESGGWQLMPAAR